MRCQKARDYCLRNRDGQLGEIEKMMLEKHINGCPDCAKYAEEMNCCLDLLCDMPELSPSDNFEWNLKRAILQEKTRRVRYVMSSSISEWRWSVKFMASAASIAAVVLVGAWLMLASPAEMEVRNARTPSQHHAPRGAVQLTPRDYGIINFTSSGYQPVIQGVSQNSYSRDGYTQPIMVDGAGRTYQMRPIEFASASREDSLMMENEFLWRRLENLEREVLVLQRLLSQERTRR